MGDFLGVQTWVGTISWGAPIALAALGGTFSERTGVVNIAMEGLMLISAFFSVLGAWALHNAWLGLGVGVVSAMLFALLFAWGAIRFKADQIILGMAINTLAMGLTGYLLNTIFGYGGTPVNTPQLPTVSIPLLASIPWLGPVLFRQNVLIYALFILLVLSHFLLFHTRLGLRMRAVGEHPQAADAAGINVYRIRYLGVLLSGFFSGLAGAYLSIGALNSFNVNMSNGRGYIALAAMIFGGWTPLGAFGASMLFGFASSIAFNLQGLGIPKDLVLMLPYVATIVALAGVVGRTTAPAADGVPYDPSESS
ncbi:MAG: ABC transporter permease [Bacillota bacterium]|nr:ABC transporter permease [Bacillota bacterium]MDI3316219.1 ABC transporter permease [Bacillota bacterium]